MNRYLKNFTINKALFQENTPGNLALCIVIPCYNEPNALQTLQSIKQCILPDVDIEVIIIINDSESAEENVKQLNAETYRELVDFAEKNSTSKLQFLVHYEKNIPKKHAGVGYARKLGMDEAVRRLNNPNGIICCLDADCTVSDNYLIEIFKHFQSQDKDTATIYFEHPVSGNEYPQDIYLAIYHYELHLRYYKNALQYTGFPFAIYTVGSSMAVKAGAYCKQGGMNKRKAGEDFYFLQKMCKLSKPIEINTCTVYPSPRTSTRVPFGTGKAVAEILSNDNTNYYTYAFESFVDLKLFFDNIEKLYNEEPIDLPASISAFLKEINFNAELKEIKANSPNFNSFEKRFFQWFNAFKVLKFIHYSRDNFYPNQPVEQETKKLLPHLKAAFDYSDLLDFMRHYDRLHSKT